MKIIQVRKRTFICTDPMRRCYDGYMKGHYGWTEWSDLESSEYLKPETDMEDRLAFWRRIDKIAEKERGREARSEYRLVTR